MLQLNIIIQTCKSGAGGSGPKGGGAEAGDRGRGVNGEVGVFYKEYPS